MRTELERQFAKGVVSTAEYIAQTVNLAPRFDTFPTELATPIFRDLERHALLLHGWDWAYNCLNGRFEIMVFRQWEPSWDRKYVVKGERSEWLYEAMVSAVVKLWMR